MMLLVASILLLAASPLQSADVFTNSFLVRLNGDHGQQVANGVAQRAGFESWGPVSKHFCH
jgi:hypothetical protein